MKKNLGYLNDFQQNQKKHNHKAVTIKNVFLAMIQVFSPEMLFSERKRAKYISFLKGVFAEINLLGALSACPGGDCGSEHSSDVAKCYPLKVSIWDVDKKYLDGISFSKTSSYNRSHGIK